MSMRSAILATALTLLPTAAFADTLTVYKVTGGFVDQVTLTPDGTLGGTLTFDSTTGTFTADTLTFDTDSGTVLESFIPPNTHQSLGADGSYEIELSTHDFTFGPPVPDNYSVLDLKLQAVPLPNQAVNICSLDNVCVPQTMPMAFESSLEEVAGHYARVLPLAYGQLTPVAGVAMTPEPSTFALLATGLLALCLFNFVRSRSRAPIR